MKKKSIEVKHPSLEGYVPNDPIPEGYKLDCLFNGHGLPNFSVEYLIPIEEEKEKAA